MTAPALLGIPAELEQPVPTLTRKAQTLSHPWSLHAQSGAGPVLLLRDFHQRWPWSERRWRFLVDRINIINKQILTVNSGELLQQIAGISMQARAADHPLYDEALRRVATVEPVPRQFANPEQFCRSFSAFWHRVALARDAA